MTPVSCNGDIDGTVSAVTTGGSGVPTFNWDVGDPNAAPAGTYTVVATDANGCTAETTIEVTEPTELQVSASGMDVVCNGESSGDLQSQVNGGVAPYTYLWSGGIANATDPNPEDVPANMYTVIVTDANGCTAVAQAEVAQPEALSASSISNESLCGDPNGSIDLTVNGGVTPYSFLWSNNDTNEDPGGLIPGAYIVTITDANGCTTVFGTTVTTPSALTISGTGADVDCFGASTGSTDITVGGGSLPYTYLWDDPQNQTDEDAQNLPAGDYTVVVTDAQGCTISTQISISEPPPFLATELIATGVSCNGGDDGSIIIDVTGGTIPYVSYEWDNTTQEVPDPENLSAGSYTLTVTDANGCTAVSEAIIIDEPAPMVLTTTTVATACNGSSDGSIDLTVEVGTGTAPYTYSWNNGTYVVEDPADIPAGQYTVVVTDDNGCTETTTVTVAQPQALQIEIDNVSNYGGYNVSCWNTADGTAQATASGGTAPYNYSWSNGANTAAIEDLAPGVYTVIVTDGGGCTNSTQVQLEAPEDIVASATAVAADCYGESDGQVIVGTVSGGAAPYMYSIGGAFSPVNQFVNLSAGDYEVIVQDANGCEWTDAVTVTEPAEFTVTILADGSPEDPEILMGDSIQLQPTLNIPLQQMDTFVWKEREVTDFEPWVMPWQTQSYSIVVTTENGCKAEDMILVRVKKDRLVYVPNTFSPNNDGFNDIFNIYTGRGVKRISNFRIFSRWGELVYELPEVAVGVNAADPDNGWDGTLNNEPMNPAVFVYVFEVEFIDGRIEMFKGDLTLTK
jgi:gliding motility-associated-like protein